MIEAHPAPDQRHSRPQIRVAQEKHAGSDYAVKYGGRDDDFDWGRASRIVQKAMGLRDELVASGGIKPAESIEPSKLAELEAGHSEQYTKDDFSFDQKNGQGWEYKTSDGPERLRR